MKGLETNLTYHPHWRTHLVISAIGAVCTGVVMIIFAVTKFTSGAWFIIVLIPAMIYVFFRIHYHYKDVAHTLSLQGARPALERHDVRILILVDDVHKETARMVDFANSLGHPWQAVHVGVNPEKAELVKKKWEQHIATGELVVLPSPFRQLTEPIKDYVEQIQREVPGCFVHVIMGHLVMDISGGRRCTRTAPSSST